MVNKFWQGLKLTLAVDCRQFSQGKTQEEGRILSTSEDRRRMMRTWPVAGTSLSSIRVLLRCTHSLLLGQARTLAWFRESASIPVEL